MESVKSEMLRFLATLWQGHNFFSQGTVPSPSHVKEQKFAQGTLKTVSEIF